MDFSPYLNIDRIEFAVTHQCTGRCLHCSVADKLNHPGEPRHVPQEAAVETVRWLAAHYDVQSVMTFGGEPMLYPDVTCAIHRTATECGIPARQIITNGFFSRDEKCVRKAAQALADAGVNDLLLSVDAFHQERIPLEMVRAFAHAMRDAGIPNARFQPAWLVSAQHENPFNARTRDILASLADIGLPVHSGNDIFLSGNAAKHLAQYYPPPCLDPAQRCGAMPYTEPLTDVRCLSIEPNGDVTACAFVIGNVLRESIADIVSRYDPFAHEGMCAAMAGVPGLLALAEKRGVSIDLSRCYSVCDLCRQVNGC